MVPVVGQQNPLNLEKLPSASLSPLPKYSKKAKGLRFSGTIRAPVWMINTIAATNTVNDEMVTKLTLIKLPKVSMAWFFAISNPA